MLVLLRCLSAADFYAAWFRETTRISVTALIDAYVVITCIFTCFGLVNPYLLIKLFFF